MSVSLQTKIWMQKFFRNKLAVMGLIIIILIIIIAIFGYTITLDKTRYANKQYIELSALPPLSKVTFVKIREQQLTENISFLKTLLYGKNDYSEYMPVVKYIIEKEKIKFIPIKAPDTEMYITFTDLGIDENSLNNNKHELLIKQKIIITQTYLLGTDRMGRDLLSRIVIGSRVSLIVGLFAVIISLIIGLIMGSLAGYFRGFIDKSIMWVMNVVWSIPTLLLVLSLSLLFKKGLWQIIIAIGLTMWVDVARIVRGQIMSIREKEYIESCRAMGFGHFRILTKHILPSTIGSLIIVSAANFASAILLESGLSFLGLGLQPPIPSWGSMIKEHYGYLLLDKAYLAILPGTCLMLVTLSFIYIGSGLRDAFEVKNTTIQSGN